MGWPAQNGKTRNSRLYDFFSRLLVLPFRAGHPIYLYYYDYDPKKQSRFISYLKTNNLYGWAVSEYLPHEGFKWLKNIDEFDVMSINEK